jgi:outer membrane protein OmpA-like peptidoglycan-associated protein
LTSTKDSDDIIIDVCIASRKIVTEKTKIVQDFTRAYFKTLEYYLERQPEFIQYLAADGNKLQVVGQRILEGIDFIDLQENQYLWFGIGGGATDKIGKVIEATIDVQKYHGKLMVNPLADKSGGAYWIVNHTFLQNLTPDAAPKITGMPTKEVAPPPVEQRREFASLKTEELAGKTQRIGELRVDPIFFETGAFTLTQQAKLVVDRFAETFTHYPNYRLVLNGYASPTGNPEANMELSRKRAGAIAQYLMRVHSVQGGRINVVAHGDREPLPRKDGESQQDWLERNQRTEFVLVKEK